MKPTEIVSEMESKPSPKQASELENNKVEKVEESDNKKCMACFEELFNQIIDASELSSKFFIIKDLLFIMEKLIRHPITLTEFEFYAKDLREIMMHVEAGTPDYRKKFFRLLDVTPSLNYQRTLRNARDAVVLLKNHVVSEVEQERMNKKLKLMKERREVEINQPFELFLLPKIAGFNLR